jgi:hypothetical protein
MCKKVVCGYCGETLNSSGCSDAYGTGGYCKDIQIILVEKCKKCS